MPPFQPYAIFHIQLADLGTFLAPASNAYLVIWSDKVPIGHLWLDFADSARPLHAEAIAKALEPALRYYLGRGDSRAKEDWQDLLAQRNYAALQLAVATLADETRAPGIAQKLSVIVCTRNRPASLEQCLNALLASRDTDFELLVIDNAPDDDRTEQLVQKFPSVRYAREPRKGKDAACNTGLQLASHPLIAYTDDDVRVDESWIGTIKTSFQDPLTMVVTGLTMPEELQTQAEYVFEKFWGFNKGFLPKKYDHRYFLDYQQQGVPVWEMGIGGNMAMRKEVFDLVGGFDERLDAGAAGCSGDSEFLYRVLAEGWNCLYLPHLVAFHRHRKSNQALRSQLFYYSRGHTCALLVQYANYHQKGNLVRLYQIIPKYYLRKIKSVLVSGHWRSLPAVAREIWGSVDGWLYYQLYKHRRKYPTKEVLPTTAKDYPGADKDALVSVIILCHKQAAYLASTLESVQQQDHPSIEIVVVDQGPDEDTRAVCARYAHVSYIPTQRVGPAAAKNIGVAYSRGRFLVFLYSGDLFFPSGVGVNLGYFVVRPDLAFVCGGNRELSPSDPSRAGWDMQPNSENLFCALLKGDGIDGEGSAMYRRELFFGFHFDPKWKAFDDYDLHLRLARRLPGYFHSRAVCSAAIHQGLLSASQLFLPTEALAILKKQKATLKTPQEIEAFHQGIRTWKRRAKDR
jgi:glycosyltransferase involved in cell wall biosynthesis